MSSRLADRIGEEADRSAAAVEVPQPVWRRWPVDWSGIWVGALSALAAVLVFGLIGVAVGAHLIGPEHRVVNLRQTGLYTLAFSIFSAFLAFVIGGWAAGRVAGYYRAETSMLHGAISWLVALPVLVVLAGLGAGSYMGAWHGGVAGSPAWAAPATPFERPELLGAEATAEERAQYRKELTDYRARMAEWREQTPRATQNAALGALTALLLGLIGSILGGWMASGEPMGVTLERARSSGQTADTSDRVSV